MSIMSETSSSTFCFFPKATKAIDTICLVLIFLGNKRPEGLKPSNSKLLVFQSFVTLKLAW